MSDTAGYAFDVAAVDLATGNLRWTEGDFRVALVSEKWTPNQSKNRSTADLGDAQVTQGVRIASRGIDSERAGRVCLTAGGVRWPRYTGEFRYAVVYNADTERLVAYADLGPQKVTNTVPVLDWLEGEVCEFLING